MFWMDAGARPFARPHVRIGCESINVHSVNTTCVITPVHVDLLLQCELEEATAMITKLEEKIDTKKKIIKGMKPAVMAAVAAVVITACWIRDNEMRRISRCHGRVTIPIGQNARNTHLPLP